MPSPELRPFTATPIEDIAGKVQAVRDTFATGVTKTYEWRMEQLNAFERMMKEEEQSFYEALEKDVRKPRIEAYGSEIAIARDDVSIAKKNLRNWMKAESVAMPLLAGAGASTKVIHEPLGTSLIVGAWNYPVMLTLGPLVSAIAAGCTAVLKPSELTVYTAEAIERAVAKHLDTDAFTVIQGGIPETTELLEQRFDLMFFTGSPAVGKIVMAAAAKQLTPVVLELGGKSPAIVCDDAKLDSAVQRIAWGKFYNAGQTCIGVDYVLVHESLYDSFITKTKAAIDKMYRGDPQGGGDYPQIVDERNANRLLALLEGEEIVYGGKSDVSDRFIEPTIVNNPAWDSPIMQEEIFGPIMPVIPFSDLDVELDRIVAGEKPLACYIFTESDATAEYILNKVSSGGACINDTLTHVTVGNAPFGGVGQSGIGNYHGKNGYLAFTHRRTVLRRTTKFDPNFLYPPYSKTKSKIVEQII